MHCNFEAAIQYDCLKSVIEIARAGEYGNGEIAEAIQHTSCFTGSAAKLAASFLPDQDVEPDIFSNSPTLVTGNAASIEDICQAIENCIPKGAGDNEKDAENIDWSLVFSTLWPLLLSLIQKLINSMVEDSTDTSV